MFTEGNFYNKKMTGPVFRTIISKSGTFLFVKHCKYRYSYYGKCFFERSGNKMHTVVKNLVHQQHQGFLLLEIICAVCLSIDVVIESTSGYIQCVKSYMDTIFRELFHSVYSTINSSIQFHTWYLDNKLFA